MLDFDTEFIEDFAIGLLWVVGGMLIAYVGYNVIAYDVLIEALGVFLLCMSPFAVALLYAIIRGKMRRG